MNSTVRDILAAELADLRGSATHQRNMATDRQAEADAATRRAEAIEARAAAITVDLVAAGGIPFHMVVQVASAPGSAEDARAEVEKHLHLAIGAQGYQLAPDAPITLELVPEPMIRTRRVPIREVRVDTLVVPVPAADPVTVDA